MNTSTATAPTFATAATTAATSSPPAASTGIPVVVTSRTIPAEGVISLELRAHGGGDLPEWQPGAHIDLVLHDDLVRQYSLCGDPTDRTSWRIAVLLEEAGRGGSRRVHEALGPGSELRVRGPRNHFRLEPADRYLFIAGGIGITPILPMLAAAEASGAQWSLIYGARRRGTMAFADELTARYGDKVVLHPQDTHGLIDLDTALGEVSREGEAALVYCCGPGPLLDAVEERCDASVLERLRVERFHASGPDTSACDESFEIEVASTGDVLTIGTQESILDVLRAKGYPVDSSCEEGTCGTCETAVIEGTVDHRDSVLTAKEKAKGELMMTCVSRASCPRLVLDI